MFDKYKTRGAYHYQWYEDNTFSYRDCVDKCMEFCKGSTLDIGCGDGLVTNLISQSHPATGIDDNAKGIELAREYGGAYFEVYDLNMPIDGKWQYMVCLNVIEHLEHPEAIKRIFNQNITKAAIIITDIPQGDLPPEHIHEFTPDELKQMFLTHKVKYFTIGKDFHGIEIYK